MDPIYGVEYDHDNATRRRKVDTAVPDDGLYQELEKLRNLVDVVEQDRTGCGRFTVNDSLMSTVFGVVLVMIISVTIYAFTNLYRAISKRFFTDYSWPKMVL